MKKVILGLLLLAFTLALIPTEALAWNAGIIPGDKNHEWLIGRTRDIMNAYGYTNFGSWMTSNLYTIKVGSSDADGLYDSRNHYCDESGYGFLYYFKSVATLGNEYYNSAVAATDLPNRRWYFGAALHCIQDGACAAHTDVACLPTGNGHSTFENWTESNRYTWTSIGSGTESVYDKIRYVAGQSAYYRGQALTCACTNRGGGYGGSSTYYSNASQKGFILAQTWSGWLANKFRIAKGM